MHKIEYLWIKYVISTTVHGDTVEHPAGRHSYNFEMEIPTTAPSSFEGQYGYVRYSVKAIIDRPWKFDHDVKAAFTVIGALDLNAEGPQLSVSCLKI